MNLITKINQAGLSGLTDPLSYRRVLFVNNLALISSTIALLVSILIFSVGLFPQYIVTFVGGLLFLFVIYLNHLGRYFIARTCFISVSVSLVTIASYIALKQGRFNEVENILIGFMAVNYLLYDGKFRYLGFWLIYGILIWLKFTKNQFLGLPFDLEFYLTLQNVTLLCVIVYLFANAFRKSLLKAFFHLNEKDEILYSMIDNVPIFLGLLDVEKQYKMVNINYEKSFGKKRNEIIGSHIKDVLPDNILQKHIPLIERTLNGESTEFLEFTEMPDGSTFYASGKYDPVVSNTGEVTGVSVFVNDITKLEEAKNKLRAANSTKDKLFSIIAHDIRGPLDLFEGLLDYSSQGAISKDDFLKHQHTVRVKLTDLRDTVNTLLEWARTQLDGVNSSPSPTNIEEVVMSNIELYQGLIDRKKIKVSVDIEPETIAIVDANHLKIGARNIIHNSLKFTGEGGKLNIRGLQIENNVILEIADSGLGMDQTKIDSILKKEVQNSKSGTAGEAGTGLGLSLSLELLEKNNCDVAISSELGKGTVTTISMQPN
ncbi:PAS domain-containing sensor histidine kinase [Ekhidna sp.]